MNDKTSFKDAVAQVKRAYDIADYIQQSGVSLKRSGAGKSVGLCPFHSEKTPSFSVDENFQNFRCFGCGANGDLLGYVQRSENLDFIEALRKLADDKGIELSFDNSESSIDYRSLRSCLKDTANFFYSEFKKLPKEHEAIKEIVDRKLSTKAMLYGYAPSGNALYKHLSEKGYSDDLIVQAGICAKSEKHNRVFDFWQSRLMFYVTDITGKPIGFSGRKLFDTATRGKYVNSPDTPLFDKSSSLYNIQNAKKKAFDEKIVYVTEGQFDVAAFVESGMENTVASLGTAFTEKQGLICRRLVTEEGRIVFCFDGDKAGIDAAIKVFSHIPSIHSQSYVVNFPDAQDPCDFRKENGSDELYEYVKNNQKPMVEFILDVIANNNDLSSPLGATHYIEQSAKVLKTISSFALREVFIKKVALESFTSLETVRKAVSGAKPLVETSQITDTVSEPQNTLKSRPEIDEDFSIDQDNLITLIDDDLEYNAAARMIAMALIQPKFINVLLRSKSLIPKNLLWVLTDISKVPEGTKIVAEDFTYSRVMTHIMSENFFPLLSIMQPVNIRDQFIYLRDYLKKRHSDSKKDNIRTKIAKVLEKFAGANSELLEKAIIKEKTELSVK